MTRARQPRMLVVLLGSWACTGAFVAAGPTADAGTLGVSGLRDGVGGHLEIGMLRERERSALGVALTGTLAGYQSEADGDPVIFTALEARSRWWLGASTGSVRPFLEAGGGPMVAWVAGPRAGGLVAHVGAGLQGGRSALQWSIALRERPAGLLGGQAEFFASTQLVFGLAVSRRRARRSPPGGSVGIERGERPVLRELSQCRRFTRRSPCRTA
jgi:hypothetical protein